MANIKVGLAFHGSVGKQSTSCAAALGLFRAGQMRRKTRRNIAEHFEERRNICEGQDLKKRELDERQTRGGPRHEKA